MSCDVYNLIQIKCNVHAHAHVNVMYVCVHGILLHNHVYLPRTYMCACVCVINKWAMHSNVIYNNTYHISMWLAANPIRADSKTLSSLPSTFHWAASHAGRFRHAFRTLMIGCRGTGVWVHNHSNMGIDPSCKASLSGCLQHAALGGVCNQGCLHFPL